MQLGIVGLPNVGKSTLFQALTNKEIDISNYPFTTIDPNVGIVTVPDERLEKLTELSNSKKTIPTAIEFVDIAGLVKGAADGEGLGNQFLANIREVDAIVHVVRAFVDEDITHVHNTIDPANDIEIIEIELGLADMQTKEAREKKRDKKDIPPLELLTDKKIIYALNVSEKQLKDGWKPDEKILKAMKGSDYVVVSNTFELLLSKSDSEEKKEYLADMGIEQSGLDELIQKCYHTLGLITFLTTGEDETRAWTAKKGDLIPYAVSAIHTDFERLFIRADVINWEELIKIGSWSKARNLGKIKTVGKDYVINEGDVVEVKI
ncbi:MAG: redox-regulated ATPase YchF [Parcubacteria group bacterium]